MNFFIIFSIVLPLVVGLSENPKLFAQKYLPKFQDALGEGHQSDDHDNAVERWNCAVRNLLRFLNPFLADNSQKM